MSGTRFCLAAFVVLVFSAGVSFAATTIPWGDPGFDSSTDLATGYWETARVHRYPGGSTVWDFYIAKGTYPPERFLLITEPAGWSMGEPMVGQHITIPETAEVVDVELYADIKKYCPRGDGGMAMGFSLLSASEWDKAGMSVPENQLPSVEELSYLFHHRMYVTDSPDLVDWTHVSLEPTEVDLLVETLNAHKGEDLVLAVHFRAAHGGSYPERAQLDNFSANITIVPEPSTLVLLAMGAVGLLAYAWRRKQRRT